MGSGRGVSGALVTVALLLARGQQPGWECRLEDAGAEGTVQSCMPKQQMPQAVQVPLQPRHAHLTLCPCQCPQEVPPEVPAHVFYEVYRLRNQGLLAASAEVEFLLTRADLAPIQQHEVHGCAAARRRGGEAARQRGSEAASTGCSRQQLAATCCFEAACMLPDSLQRSSLKQTPAPNIPRHDCCRCRSILLGTGQVYRLTDLLLAARRKHGSMEGLQRHLAGLADADAERRRAAQESMPRRREELSGALAQLGIPLE